MPALGLSFRAPPREVPPRNRDGADHFRDGVTRNREKLSRFHDPGPLTREIAPAAAKISPPDPEETAHFRR